MRIFRNSTMSLGAELVLVGVVVLLSGCAITPVTREIRKVEEFSSLHPKNYYIKAHMKDGTVYILYGWNITRDTSHLLGYGTYLDINRKTIESRHKGSSTSTKESFNIPFESIALFETNQTGESIGGGLGLVTGITAGFTILCITNPKACFGSCPTFYAFDGDTMTLMAEGFSSSIAPSLEKHDIDMLYDAVPSSSFQLHLTNEALETHAIRYARILAFEKRADQRVFSTPQDKFFLCDHITPPVTCLDTKEDYTHAVTFPDGNEFFSLADEDNLNSKEELLVTFYPGNAGSKGLIVGKRQTLMTTFLMYQGLAYMGHTVAYWLAELERGAKRPENDVFNVLGGIEIFRKTSSGEWILEGIMNETGPIATDYSMIPLSTDESGPIELKLRLNKGLWRIDYLAMATLQKQVEPIVISPSRVDRVRGTEAHPHGKLLDENAYLVTTPGDAYTITYDLPFTKAELFLDSRGYYLEWIREEWTREQNFRKLNQFLHHPEKFLKNIASTYKTIEPTMEETFWNSRYEQ